LVLDGQQRLTSLYQALYANTGVRLESYGRGRKPQSPESRMFYVNIEKALNEQERSDAVEIFSENRIRNTVGGRSIDVSTREKEIANDRFPIWTIMGIGKAYDEWGLAYSSVNEANREKWLKFKDIFIQPIQNYQLPTLTLGRDCSLDALCLIFEKVNTTGVQLNVFDLLTARFAAQKFDLRADWKSRVERITFPAENEVLGRVSPIEYLQTISLLASYQRKVTKFEDRDHFISCRKKDLLNISLEEYEQWNERVVKASTHVSAQLKKFHVFTPDMLPYRSQVLILMFLYTWYHDDLRVLENNQSQLQYWFYSTSLGEYYNSSTETRVAQDIEELVQWLEKTRDEQPRCLSHPQFNASRLNDLKSKASAPFRAMFSLMMREGSLDLCTGQTINEKLFFSDEVELRHIFPKSWLRKNQRKTDVDFDSILNLAPITITAAKHMGSVGPREYLYRLRKDLGVHVADVQTRIASHMLSYPDLESEAYNITMNKRRSEIIRMIESAMGKAVARE